MRLLLIRHGQSVGNAAMRIQGWDDLPLTGLGHDQAGALAGRIAAEYQVAALYSSPLLRARQTAEAVAEHSGLTVHYDDRLKENDCGAITGMCFEEVEARYPEIAEAWQHSPWHIPIPGEEGLGCFRERVLASMDDIVAAMKEQDTAAVVAHGGTLSVYLAGLLGLDHHRRQPWLFDNASLSVVVLDPVRPRIALLNDTCHLNHRQ